MAFAILLKPDGVATFEFHHLKQLVDQCQFDTIYHEHFSYLSLTAVATHLRSRRPEVFDVEELPTHGGSLRVFAQRADTGRHSRRAAVDALLAGEAAAGMRDRAYYAGFQDRVLAIKHEFLTFLLTAQADGKSVAGYGAAAKGNTLLNFAGVRPDLLGVRRRPQSSQAGPIPARKPDPGRGRGRTGPPTARFCRDLPVEPHRRGDGAAHRGS